MTVAAFEAAPPLPAWLETEMPFQRLVFTGARYPIHFVDHGRGMPVLMLHGNPTWSFLWRKVIRALGGAELRIVAPDLVGLGLSAKPSMAAHTLEMHVAHISALVEALDLRQMVVVGQDWGGPVGALVAARLPDRVAAAVWANTAISAPSRQPRVTLFHRFSHWPVISDLMLRRLNLLPALLPFAQGDRASIDRLARRAYRYPLRRAADRAAPLALARMVPTRLDHPSVPLLREAEKWALGWRGPVRLVWGLRDPILGPALGRMRRLFPAAEVLETGAGHFLQEEVAEVIADAILDVSEKAACGAPPVGEGG